MASITVRNFDDGLKQRLRIRAATHGHSMEEEVRDILRVALASDSASPRNLADSIRARVETIGGFDLDIAPRDPIREPPDFGR
jgi:plasmid stability protein